MKKLVKQKKVATIPNAVVDVKPMNEKESIELQGMIEEAIKAEGGQTSIHEDKGNPKQRLYREKGTRNTITYSLEGCWLKIESKNNKNGLTSEQLLPCEEFLRVSKGFKTVKDWCKHDVRRFKQELKLQEKSWHELAIGEQRLVSNGEQMTSAMCHTINKPYVKHRGL